MVSAVDEQVVRDAVLDQAIAEIDQRIGAQLAAICNHPDLKRMQGMWLGLEALVGAVGNARNTYIDMLICSREDLAEDFDVYLDLTDSALFHHLYKTEYDQAGGQPYTSVLMQYSFGNTAADISLLRQISKVAAACHCPVLVDAAPSLFDRRNIEDIEQISDFELHFSNQIYTKWRAFSQAEDTRYLGMILPRVRMGHTGRGRVPRWCRHPGLREADRAWTGAVNAFGIVLVRSFIAYGWCVYIRGAGTGGMIEEIEAPDLGMDGLSLYEPPLEVLFSDRQEHALSELGLVPLCYHRRARKIIIYSAPTLQNVSRLRSESGHFDRLAASLPYLYLISRIAHYQKAIQRENIGLTNDAGQLQTELERWLEKLVTTMRDPTMTQRSERPLAGGVVTVREDPATPGFFRVQLVVQPHLQLEGVNAKLELATKMPRKKE